MEDLHSYINFLDERFPNEIMHIKETISERYESTAYAVALEKKGKCPVLVFEKVKNYTFPIVSNIFASRERIARILEAPLHEVYEVYNKKLECLKKPKLVDSAPVKEIQKSGSDVDVNELPIPIHFKQDAGQYVSSGIVIAKDPKTGRRNTSWHRMQLKGKNKFGISLHSRGHLWEYLRRAENERKDLDVAVVIGAHPLFCLGASARVSFDVDEYEVAGAFMGKPLEIIECETVDLEVPANAEIVLEGRIRHDLREPEGPFSEYPGYATVGTDTRSTRNVLEISAMTFRENAYFHDVVPGYTAEHLFLGGIGREADTFKKLKQSIPYVTGISYPKSGAHFHCYVSLDKVAEGQPKQVLALLFGLDPYLKLAVAVDNDINIFDEEEVLWALATRMQADEDIFIIPEVICNVLDPSSKEGMSAKMGIDATKPIDWKFEKCSIPEETVKRVETELNKYEFTSL